MSEHSKLFSPSASSRWLRCWASAWLNADKERKSNPDADRGTTLHDFMQKNFDNPDPDYSTLPKADRADAKTALEAAIGLTMDYDMALTGEILLEQEVKVLDMEEIFGTVDLIGFNPETKHLLILDYKFGYGEVLPEWNPQLLIYALGARRIWAKIGINTITLAIIQPQRSSKPRLFNLTNQELNSWEEGNLKPAYEGINSKVMTYAISDEACKWCPSKLDCPARNEELTEVLWEPFDSGPEKGVFDKLEMVARLRDWCNTVESEAEDLLKNGVTDPRWKLVQGKANRRWADEEEAAKWLAARGLKEKERYNLKIIGIPDAERLVSPLIKDNPRLQTAFARLIDKPEGKITYAKASDPRRAVVVAPVVMDTFDDELDNL